MTRLQVWFAHKPLCGPSKADFKVLPDFTPAESELLQSPAFLRTLPQRRVRGRSTTMDQAMLALEYRFKLVPGSIMQVRLLAKLADAASSGD